MEPDIGVTATRIAPATATRTTTASGSASVLATATLAAVTATLAEATATLAEPMDTRPIQPYIRDAHGYVVPIGALIAAHISEDAFSR